MNVSFTKSTTNHFYPTCPHHLKRFWMVPNPSTLGRIITIRRSPPSSMITLPHSSHRVESCRRRNVMMKIMSHALSLLRHDSLPPSVNTASVARAPEPRSDVIPNSVHLFNHDSTTMQRDEEDCDGVTSEGAEWRRHFFVALQFRLPEAYHLYNFILEDIIFPFLLFKNKSQVLFQTSVWPLLPLSFFTNRQKLSTNSRKLTPKTDALICRNVACNLRQLSEIDNELWDGVCRSQE